MRFALTLILLLVASLCQAAPVADTEPQFWVGDQGNYGERVFDLPNDASAWSLSYFHSETPSARERAILSWFTSDPQLARLRKQTHFNVYSPKSSLWSRYASSLPALPCVRLQKPNGAVVGQHSGLSSHLDSADNLKRAIRADMLGPQEAAIKTHINLFPRLRPCPCPNPDPGPDPYQPDNEPNEPKPATPDTPGEPEPLTPEQEAEIVEEDRHEVAIALVVFLLVLGFAYVKDRQAQTY